MNLAKMIDHTILKPDATKEEVARLCKEALAYGFASVCVNQYYTNLVAGLLAGSKVKTCTVVGFPLGAVKPEVKVYETKRAILEGAEEIDMVINIGALKDGDEDLVYHEIKAVVDKAKPRTVKVILETCLLTEGQIEKACHLAVSAGAHYVKTSSGFSKEGATIAAVALMKRAVGNNAKVKASGGIRDYAAAKAMIEAGADRIGTSAGVAIIEGMRSQA